MLKPIIFLCCLSLLSAYHTNGEVIENFFDQLKVAENEIFKWLRDEYRMFLNDDDIPARLKRENDNASGENWYKKFQCRAENKSCSNDDGKNGQRTWQISDEKSEKHLKIQFDDEKLHASQKQQQQQHEQIHEEINDKIMDDVMQQQQQVLSEYRRHHQHEIHAENTNSNDAAINRLLNAKTSMAAKQNEIHEIEMKHQHLTTSSSLYLDDENFSLNENQLNAPDMINAQSSNNNFQSSNLDTQSFIRDKRSPSHKQNKKHYDDQFNLKKNNLYDELEDTSALQQQQQESNEPHNRVKRRDAINQINHIDRLSKSDYYLINPDDNLLNDKQHVNTSTATAKMTTSTAQLKQEMNNGNEKISNDKSDCMQTVNNDEIEKMPTSSNHERIMRKRDIQSQSHTQQHHLYAIKGRQKISDLISGELSNEIVKATHNLVNSNELLKQQIKPHLDEPQYSMLKDPYQLKSNKMNSEMSNLVSYINELVNDQIQMRSCIQLTPELQKFYSELMGENKNSVSNDSERNKKSVKDFLMTRRKFKRNANHNHRISKIELEDKCKRVYEIHAECLKIEKCTNVKPSLIQYFKGHEEICEAMKNSYKKNSPMKHKRSLEGVTTQFAKLYEYKNYFLEANIDDF